ncbi:MAG: Ppx/GppA family phosphatase [Burkholderiaceae bacterium]|jgi:exopolyphosphatase/guanosine-5'-triphosphate,3'-diphosphate pyrophosphatase|nr:Ppx/GppA family phosphatase [Burkholderiaceae bacterium]
MKNGSRLAAVDLGSNSFRLEIGYVEHGQIQRAEYLKETVRLGSGLDEARNLSPVAIERALACLARFGERLAGFAQPQVRAVATQTLREARNREGFLAQAQAALGFPIDVISGREEARLIYQGAAHALPQSGERRLVMDIGGRSTELVTGQGFVPLQMESYRLGSVAWSMRYFADGALTAHAFEVAEVAAKAILDDARGLYAQSQARWERAYGCSGTISAVAEVLAAAGRASADGQIDRAGLNWLRERLIKAGHVDNIRIEGVKEERKSVIGGGLAVLRAAFDLLEIDTLQYADGALRQGALYDLLSREHTQTDVRAASIERLARQFRTDAEQAARVAQTARHLYTGAAGAGAPRGKSRAMQEERQLHWAAQLLEIGALISHADYHKHSAYILGNTDAPGFSLDELRNLSQLVLGHRGKLRKLEARFDDAAFMHQLMALRLAVILCHARTDPDLQSIRLSLKPDADGAGRCFTLRCGAHWQHAWPQSAWLLQQEAAAWAKTPWTLRLKSGRD